MKRLAPSLLAGSAAFALSLSLLQPAQANPAERTPDEGDGVARVKPDDRHGLYHKKLLRQKRKALELLDAGKAKLEAQPGGGSTVQLSDDTWVEFPIEKEDKILTILSQFGTTGSGKLGRTPGPVHNQIPEPNRASDNSTYWVTDFNRAHYENMFNGPGESFRNFYTQLSSGRYTATNTVEDWVTVPGNGSTYGDNAVEDAGGAWQFIADSGNSWYAAQLAAGKSAADIDAYLAQFDEWDRYDFDADGDFNEADGYIDHFQAVHAGEGEEAGADADAIWSHRWYAYPNTAGSAGPSVGDTANLNGGTRIGSSQYFIGDYTVEPENGGLGVFAHEFGHDLGLPDFYDTAGGENGTSFWTLMSSGSWLGHGTDGIGTTPGLMGPEEKLFLGWLDYTEVNAGDSGEYTLGPAQHTYDGADQALKVNLPDSEVVNDYTTPPTGSHAWYSGRGDNLTTTLTRAVPAATKVNISAAAWYQIEAGYDYLYAEYSLDDGQTWQRAGTPLDGVSRGWTAQRYSYAANGQSSLFRFRYATDGGVNEAGAFLDDISITTGKTYSFTDGAESGTNGWTANGWSISTGTESKLAKRYYLIENRQYVGYDATLREGPYNFSEGVTRPNWVEFLPFQDGMLVWLVDESYTDNNATPDPGHGYALPVDARPNSLTYPDGSSPSNRREPFDATFSLDATDAVCLHKQVAGAKGAYTTAEACAPSTAGITTFDDSDPEAYWDSANPQNSTKVAGIGVTATITANNGGFLTVAVSNPAP